MTSGTSTEAQMGDSPHWALVFRRRELFSFWIKPDPILQSNSPKLASLGVCGSTDIADAMSENTIQFELEKESFTIAPEIYGHFAEHLGRCIYGGIWVGEDSPIPNIRGIRKDVIEALRELDIPVLRWPGGCFADEYHWRDGIGPREKRPGMVNTTWGKVVENNHFGTHEFFDLIELLGTKAYVCGNVGSGTVQEMMEWVEYMTSDADSPIVNQRRANGREKHWKLEYFGVGNESWGCGGSMRPEYYADLYRRYNTFVKNYGPERIYRIACGANDFDLNWTEVMMERAGSKMDGLSLHYYTRPTGSWADKGPATGFGETEYHATLSRAWEMRKILADHDAIMDKYDPDQRVGLIVDEWGIWTDVEPGTNPAFLYQQNSLRDAIVAALHFQFFHEHADRIDMANIAQTVNVLQAMILTHGPKMLRTPTYWVFEMYKVHQGAKTVPLSIESGEYTLGEESVPRVSATASRNVQSEVLNLSLVNLDPNNEASIQASLEGLPNGNISGRILTAERVDSHNTFDSPDEVIPGSFDAAAIKGGSLKVVLPPKSIVVLEIQE